VWAVLVVVTPAAKGTRGVGCQLRAVSVHHWYNSRAKALPHCPQPSTTHLPISSTVPAAAAAWAFASHSLAVLPALKCINSPLLCSRYCLLLT